MVIGAFAITTNSTGVELEVLDFVVEDEPTGCPVVDPLPPLDDTPLELEPVADVALELEPVAEVAEPELELEPVAEVAELELELELEPVAEVAELELEEVAAIIVASQHVV